MEFKEGEKLVCINQLIPDERDNKLGIKMPIKGNIYTIREILPPVNGYVGIRLTEIINPKDNYIEGFQEVCFNINHFRKMDYEFAENIISELNKMTNQQYQLN